MKYRFENFVTELTAFLPLVTGFFQNPIKYFISFLYRGTLWITGYKRLLVTETKKTWNSIPKIFI